MKCNTNEECSFVPLLIFPFSACMPFSFVILLTPGQLGDFVNTESFLHLSRTSLFFSPKKWFECYVFGVLSTPSEDYWYS